MLTPETQQIYKTLQDSQPSTEYVHPQKMGPWIQKKSHALHPSLHEKANGTQNKMAKFLASIKLKDEGRREKMMKKKQVKLFEEEEIVLSSPMTEEVKLGKSQESDLGSEGQWKKLEENWKKNPEKGNSRKNHKTYLFPDDQKQHITQKNVVEAILATDKQKSKNILIRTRRSSSMTNYSGLNDQRKSARKNQLAKPFEICLRMTSTSNQRERLQKGNNVSQKKTFSTIYF